MFSSLEDHCRQNIYATVVFVRQVRLSLKCIYKLFVFQHFTSYIKTKEEGSVGEDLPGLVINHHLHGEDALAPALDLPGEALHLVPVQHAGLDPGQHHALVHLNSAKYYY